MRVIAAGLTILAIGASAHASAAECGAAPNTAELFVRSHKVHHFNGEPPSLVQDQLALWKTKDGASCFLLTTIGPNHHQCEVLSTASVIAENRLEYRQGNCLLTFEKGTQGIKLTASPGWERMGRGGVCTKTNCGMYGEVESGAFRAKRWLTPASSATLPRASRGHVMRHSCARRHERHRASTPR